MFEVIKSQTLSLVYVCVCVLVNSVSAKIKAIEAKLQMMEENVDEEYSGPSPYLYNKPPEKKDKRSQPYSKPFRRFKR